MYITEIEISDLRCYKGTQTLSLDRGDGRYAGWTVFAGRNGSGKSTLLKALALSVIGPMAARSLVGTFPGWVRRGESLADIATVQTKLIFDHNVDKFQQGYVIKNGFWTGLQWLPYGASGSKSDAMGRF